jgi:predicted Zn-dependent protease with MMP-like domain
MRAVKVTMDRFEDAVTEAIDSIPEAFQSYLEGIEFVVAESSPEGILGLYEGATALHDDWPQRITVYKLPHERSADSWRELVAEIRRTILHEVGHHFGMEEHELPY